MTKQRTRLKKPEDRRSTGACQQQQLFPLPINIVVIVAVMIISVACLSQSSSMSEEVFQRLPTPLSVWQH